MDIIEALAIFTGDWAQGIAPPPWRINIPDIFGEAWLHLVMGLVLSIDMHHGSYEASREFEAFRQAIIKGRRDILQELAPDPLEDNQAVLSSGLMSSIIGNLVNSGVPAQADTTSTYLEYLDRLIRQ